ncbi:MAG: hypothetical protein H7A24_09720 [Leptospiraceae bacterium]|nr:hypothetical protein [Leptospiraceae bacterium]MCP5512149.1 hypothetical protein [Leptospiraceae bacterium]
MKEKKEITAGYPEFANRVLSGGVNFKNWVYNKTSVNIF